MNRRHFFQVSAGSAAAAYSTAKPAIVSNSSDSASASGEVSLKVSNNRITVETFSLSAVIENGFIISLKSRETGEQFIQDVDVTASAALQLIYRSDETVPVDKSKFGRIETVQLSRYRAEIILHSWDGDGVIGVEVDPESGDLMIEPSAYSSRPGVRSCRWNMPGIRSDLDLVAPFFQGVRLKMNDALIRDSHWAWPMFWEAGLAILQASAGGFWVHTQDDRYRYKALKVGSPAQSNVLGFDTEAFGPIDNNLSAGGLVWRINVFKDNWKIPAQRYRSWLRNANKLGLEKSRRQPWIDDVKLAVSWCPTEKNVLQALKKKIEPNKVLLHVPNWRSDAYDENYPSYTASEKGKAFIQFGQSLGFHMMPHFNSVDMDPSHPSYAFLRDFQYRGIDRHDLQGWSWYEGRPIGVPESNASRLNNRDKKVMVKIHPGLGMWRSILGRNMLQAVRDLGLDTAFIDVTLVSHNLHNCFADATSPTEGMKKLIRHVADLGEGLVVGGEGLNEITMQGQSFAQVHLFRSWHDSIEGLERTGNCALNTFLFGDLCRTIGYAGLGGRNDNEILRMRIHEEHETIPTLTIRSADDITNPNQAVKRFLEVAAG